MTANILKKNWGWCFLGMVGNFNFIIPTLFNRHLLGLKIQELIEWDWFWNVPSTLVHLVRNIMIIFLQSPEITVCFFVNVGDKYPLFFILMESIFCCIHVR